ncbi:hypothetical protein K432DRAFT_407428 [Lepidopterella palustris CBS 459.81]|uniref:Uncharacterized protein n=1 Tax=Lepidopterella palustris CBS 459.81 TaxID=1314670 RepID=A0A8E2E4M5_9PEZI|nr:hypothetical protein K432DRAFT_407428 [Lepidopterella palustris CBS 459.81]
MPDLTYYNYALHRMNDEEVRKDITVYLETEMSEIYRRHTGRKADWPDQESIRCLAARAGKLFIYASTAYRFVDEGDPLAFADHLEDILKDDSEGSDDIDKMYTQNMEHQIRHLSNKDKTRVLRRFRHIVGTIVILFSSPTMDSVSKLLSQSDPDSRSYRAGSYQTHTITSCFNNQYPE